MSVNAQAYANYKSTAIETATPGRLLLMLYNAAIRNLDEAVINIKGNDLESAHNRLVKAQEIIVEFMCTLNMDYEISHKLMGLYDYLYRRLIEANVNKDVEKIEEVRVFLVELRDTWQEVVSKTSGVNSLGAAANGGLNVRG